MTERDGLERDQGNECRYLTGPYQFEFLSGGHRSGIAQLNLNLLPPGFPVFFDRYEREKGRDPIGFIKEDF